MSPAGSFILLRVYFSSLVIFFILRIGFLFYNYPIFSDARAADLAQAFLNGLMIDSSVAASTLFLIRLLTLLIQWISRTVALKFHTALVYIFFGLYFFANLSDILFFNEFDSRLNILFLENLGQMGPILGTIVRDYSLFAVTAAWLVVMVAFVLMNNRLTPRLQIKSFKPHPIPATVASLLLLVAFSFLWTAQPFWRTGAFSAGNQALNQLSLNGVYTLIKAYDQRNIIERDLGGVNYQFGPLDEALESVRARILGANEEYIPGLYPLARRIKKPVTLSVSKPNIVIILMEGFSASYVGVLSPDGVGCSPGFDELAQDGILFTNFYGHETRTHHGLVSTVGSFPSILGMFVTRRRGTESFYTLATLLKKYGYSTSFFYGYDQGFDNMGWFLKQGGVDRIIDQTEFPSPRFRAEWGVSDEDLFEKVNEVFSQQSPDTPFFSIVLTSSNHTPHEVPEHFSAKHPEYSGDKLRAAFAYSDFALKQFIDNARDEKYFDNTIFVMVADHGEIRDTTDRYLKRFHIPCLIYGPHLIPQPQVVATIGGQVDIGTTLMHLIGFPHPFHFVGRNLPAIPENEGFAVMRNNYSLYLRAGQTVLVRDIRDTLSMLHPVDSFSRMQQSEVVLNDSLNSRLNQDLEWYLQTVHHLFSKGEHRVRERGALDNPTDQ